MRGYFFNAEPTTDYEQHPTGYDRAYDALDYNLVMGTFFHNGIFGNINPDACKAVVDGLTATFVPGVALINGGQAHFDPEDKVELAAGDGHYSIMCRKNTASEVRAFELVALKGDDYPVPVREADIYDLCLAHVLVEDGMATVTDTRGDRDICGFAAVAGQPPYQPSTGVPAIVWDYTLFPAQLTEEQRQIVESTPSLMEMFEASRPKTDWFTKGEVDRRVLNEMKESAVTYGRNKYRSELLGTERNADMYLGSELQMLGINNMIMGETALIGHLDEDSSLTTLPLLDNATHLSANSFRNNAYSIAGVGFYMIPGETVSVESLDFRTRNSQYGNTINLLYFAAHIIKISDGGTVERILQTKVISSAATQYPSWMDKEAPSIQINLSHSALEPGMYGIILVGRSTSDNFNSYSNGFIEAEVKDRPTIHVDRELYSVKGGPYTSFPDLGDAITVVMLAQGKYPSMTFSITGAVPDGKIESPIFQSKDICFNLTAVIHYENEDEIPASFKLIKNGTPVETEMTEGLSLSAAGTTCAECVLIYSGDVLPTDEFCVEVEAQGRELIIRDIEFKSA